MNKKNLIILTILFSLLLLSSCTKEEDEQMENDLIGYWIALDDNGDPEVNIPEYTFEEDNKGFTSLNGSHEDVQWEVKGGQLKVYYDKAPPYMIGYDQYNSRSLFEIKKLEDDHLEVIQFYHEGYQADLDFYRQ